MEEQKKIIFQVQTQQGKRTIQFDKKLLDFNIGILNNNQEQPYLIPNTIINTLEPLQVMKQFVQTHNYSPKTFKVNKPIKSSNFQDQVDQITYNVLYKFSKEENIEATEKLIILSKFLDFNQLYEASRAAVAVNFFIGLDQKSFQQFERAHGLQNISTQEICQIMKENEQIFTMIQLKAKQQLFSEQDKN